MSGIIFTYMWLIKLPVFSYAKFPRTRFLIFALSLLSRSLEQARINYFVYVELFFPLFSSHKSLRPSVCHVLAQTIQWRLAVAVEWFLEKEINGNSQFSLEEPMRNLKCSLTELITSMSDQIKSRENTDYYKITKIVRALWLAERRVCMRVFKHGCVT